MDSISSKGLAKYFVNQKKKFENPENQILAIEKELKILQRFIIVTPAEFSTRENFYVQFRLS